MACKLFLLAGLISAVLADRGNAPHASPSICNDEPTMTSDSTGPTSTPQCEHAADPSGGMGLCPNLSNKGWCDCGTDGNYPMLSGNDICGYTDLPASTLALTKTNCQATATRSIVTLTVVPVPITSTGAAQLRREAVPTYTAISEKKQNERQAKRGAGTITYSDSCNAAPPRESWVDAGFKTQKDVLAQAYKDAVTLASLAQSVASDNKGFTHYFGGAKADVQYQHFKKMMQGIASSDAHYSIHFTCSAQHTKDCAGESELVTDASVASGASDVKGIEVCPEFWSSASTAYLLYDAQHTTPSPPWRTQNQWCRKSTANGDSNVSYRVNQFFATAGHSVLHELTHLDSLAEFAALDAPSSGRDAGRHGTDDVGGCELKGARDWLPKYVADSDETSPDYNAESYAAAATEIWVMDVCGFSQIRPVT